MRNLLVKILKKAVRLVEKREVPTVTFDDLILKNVFQSNYEKRVLISYLKQPFIEGIKYHHTNYLECYTAAEIFHELGYQIDVIDLFEDSVNLNFGDYQVVYGLGVSLEKSFTSKEPERILKILYSTGCNPFYSYLNSTLQVQRFFSKTGLLLPNSSRVMPSFFTFQYLLSDFVIALGNKFVAKTFTDVNPDLNCEFVNAFYFDKFEIDLKSKNFVSASKNFLWFGSIGMLHKGLDLLIDIFSNRQEIFLHICGPTDSEMKFWNYYNPIIKNCKNIIIHGYIDIESEKFKELMMECAFCIFPTASEGGSPSLLNVMANGGLIPLTTGACGIDIDSIGFQFNKISEKEIVEVINHVFQLTSNEVQEKATNVLNRVRTHYTYEKYKINMTQKINKAIALFNSKKSAINNF